MSLSSQTALVVNPGMTDSRCLHYRWCPVFLGAAARGAIAPSRMTRTSSATETTRIARSQSDAASRTERARRVPDPTPTISSIRYSLRNSRLALGLILFFFSILFLFSKYLKQPRSIIVTFWL